MNWRLQEIARALRLAAVSVARNRLRSALAMFSVVVGLLTFILIASALAGMDAAVNRTASAIGTDVLYVQRFSWAGSEPWWERRGRPYVTRTEGDAVARESRLALAVAMEAHEDQSVVFRGRTAEKVMIVGHTANAAVVRSYDLLAGRQLLPEDVQRERPVCLLGPRLAEELFAGAPPPGAQVKLRNAVFEVIGVLDWSRQAFGAQDLDRQLIIPLSRFVREFGYEPDVAILAKARAVSELDDLTEEIRGILRKARRLAPVQPDNFAVNQQGGFVNSYRRVSRTVAGLGFFLTGLALFVAGSGITNIMFMTVTERTREIGIRKAIGARETAIRAQFLFEAALICLAGAAAATLLAVPLVPVLGRWLPATLSWTVVCTGAAVALLLGLFAGSMPAHSAARLEPIEALRHE
ncbi:MAG: ABC transporter permease [Verrucomicrobia bacterium]|nr:ABC transporter permease [Verrucomicrobiota bacterium]